MLSSFKRKNTKRTKMDSQEASIAVKDGNRNTENEMKSGKDLIDKALKKTKRLNL